MKVYEIEHDICTLETGIMNYNLSLFSSKENAIKTAQYYVRNLMGVRGYDEEEIDMEVKALKEGRAAVFEDFDMTEHTLYISERTIHEEAIQ